MTRLHRIALAVLLTTLAGCSSLLGPKDTPTIYAPRVATTAAAVGGTAA